MVTGALKSKIDSIWDTMWSGGISNPLTVIEQLTYLLFIKRLDELHTLRERKATRTDRPIEEPVFDADQDRLRWSRFKDAAPERMFETMRDDVFAFIKTLGQTGEAGGEGGSTYSHHMKDALFMMPTPRVLANVVDQLDRDLKVFERRKRAEDKDGPESTRIRRPASDSRVACAPSPLLLRRAGFASIQVRPCPPPASDARRP